MKALSWENRSYANCLGVIHHKKSIFSQRRHHAHRRKRVFILLKVDRIVGIVICNPHLSLSFSLSARVFSFNNVEFNFNCTHTRTSSVVIVQRRRQYWVSYLLLHIGRGNYHVYISRCVLATIVIRSFIKNAIHWGGTAKVPIANKELSSSRLRSSYSCVWFTLCTERKDATWGERTAENTATARACSSGKTSK